MNEKKDGIKGENIYLTPVYHYVKKVEFRSGTKHYLFDDNTCVRFLLFIRASHIYELKVVEPFTIESVLCIKQCPEFCRSNANQKMLILILIFVVSNETLF